MDNKRKIIIRLDQEKAKTFKSLCALQGFSQQKIIFDFIESFIEKNIKNS